MKGKVESIFYTNGWHMVVGIEEGIGEARRLSDKGGMMRITFTEWRDARSLSANSYFHLLVNKLAKVIRISDEDCKRLMVLSYGTVKEQDGMPIVITLPKATNPIEFYPYCEEIFSDSATCSYQLYKQTRDMNSSEFARLIDGVVEECKEQGIETLPPAELERLYAQASKNKSN